MCSINFDLTLPRKTLSKLDINDETSEYGGSADSSIDNCNIGGIGVTLMIGETTVITYDRNKILFWHGCELIGEQKLSKEVSHVAFGSSGNLTIVFHDCIANWYPSMLWTSQKNKELEYQDKPFNSKFTDIWCKETMDPIMVTLEAVHESFYVLCLYDEFTNVLKKIPLSLITSNAFRSSIISKICCDETSCYILDSGNQFVVQINLRTNVCSQFGWIGCCTYGDATWLTVNNNFVYIGFKKKEGSEIFKFSKDNGIIEGKHYLPFRSYDACSDHKNIYVLIEDNDYVKILDF